MSAYVNRPIRSADDVAFVIAADFVAACVADGDTANAARWRNVIWVERVMRGLAKPRHPNPVLPLSNTQHSLPLM